MEIPPGRNGSGEPFGRVLEGSCERKIMLGCLENGSGLGLRWETLQRGWTR